VVSAPPADTRWTFDRRDALALVNGTGASLALLALSWWEIAALLPVALESMAHMVSAMGLARTAYADQLQRARIHPGQAAAAEAMRIASAREPAGRVEASAARSKASDGGLLRHEQAIQSAYSFRAIPQVLGPCLEALWDVYQVAERELNAVTDNPIFEPPDQVFHGANFHGHVVAHAADRLALVAADIAQLLDRQLARITDPMLNHGLPPFLTGDEVGASSGFMGAQVTATALAAELSASAQRRYVLESRSTNGANQDIVSMSTLAALSLYNAVPRLQEMVAVHAMCAIQAVELASTDAGRTTGTRGAKTSLACWVRSQSAFLSKDRPLSGDIMRIAAGLSAITGTRSAPYREAAAMKPAAEGEGGMERGSPPESAAVTVLGPPLDLWATLYGGITPRPDHDWVG
jgi:tyrosine ammonia-lyase